MQYKQLQVIEIMKKIFRIFHESKNDEGGKSHITAIACGYYYCNRMCYVSMVFVPLDLLGKLIPSVFTMRMEKYPNNISD